jgi:hypothetical protein
MGVDVSRTVRTNHALRPGLGSVPLAVRRDTALLAWLASRDDSDREADSGRPRSRVYDRFELPADGTLDAAATDAALGADQ